MAVRWDVTEDDNVFIGEDHDFSTLIYVPGTTRAMIQAGNGVREIVTGWTFEWVVRQDPDDAEEVIRYASDDVDHIITIGATPTQGGPVLWTLERAATLTLRPGRYHHTLRRTNVNVSKVLTFGAFFLQMPDTR